MSLDQSAVAAASYERFSDIELARRCADRDRGAVEYVIRANNQRLFRTAWSILKSRFDAEEAVQSAYLSAFSRIGSFEGRSSLSTWLTRIAINEALGRRRAEERRRHHLEQEGVAVLEDYRDALMRGSETEAPDATLAREQVRKLLEQAVGELEEPFRTVFVLREVEGLSTADTAACLGLSVDVVKTRLSRARAALRRQLFERAGMAASNAFTFQRPRCDRVVAAVLARIG